MQPPIIVEATGITVTNHMTQMNKPEDVPGAFAAAWNAHDMVALGALFDADATFVNRFGHYVRGR